MKEKVVLITGGSRGLGKKIVERLAVNNDSIVCFTYVNPTEIVLKQSQEKKVYPFLCDQQNEEEVKSAVNSIHSEFGKIDILINNACPAFTPSDFLDSQWGSFQSLLDVNVKGAYFFSKEVSRLMKEAHSGKIINILSSYVFNLPPEKIAFYITAKYALLGLSKALAVELAKYGITVNMISPGLMATDLSQYLPRKFLEVYSKKHPMGRMTTTDDAADILEFLISDKADFLNGVNIPVNGGEMF
ncbi:MAG: hypothetical protein APF84_17825 [Gracilibacter sp. BRH_c7a]|nr:MAG: hypothetical protein APF84_17825 [Gracilibacter sp. BRH_c7a]